MSREGTALVGRRDQALAFVMPRVHVPACGGCWLWEGSRTPSGYGVACLTHAGTFPVHRLVHELFIGPIPDGYEVDHRCSNRSCVNPSHLEAVPKWLNVNRAMRLTGRTRANSHMPEMIWRSMFDGWMP